MVEDEADSRELFELLLASEGALVRSAASADQALALFDAVAPDVILPRHRHAGAGRLLARPSLARRPPRERVSQRSAAQRKPMVGPGAAFTTRLDDVTAAAATSA